MVEIAVHIADVCSFVEEGSALDLEARERATTIYLTHERYDMLPSLISSDIASLHGDKDRFTVSVLWNVKVQSKEDGGRVVNEMDDLLALDDKNDLVFIIPDTPTWVGRAMIHSVAAATYSQAHNLIYDLPPCAGEAFVPHGQAGRPIDQSKRERLRTDIRGLTAFSRFLNRKRETAGALDLSQGAGAELKFKIDVEGNPVEVQGKEELEIHHTISELMIAANSAVASIIYAATPLQTLLRIHPPPSNEKLKRLQEEILETGIDVFQRNNSSSELRKELRSYREHISKQSGSVLVATTDAVDLITSVVISSMNEAKYVSSSILSGELLIQNMSDAAAEARYLGHFGLGLKYYTHFTSPIRRYADIIVHRQLLRILQVQQPDLHENIHVDSQVTMWGVFISRRRHSDYNIMLL
jgi:DIS3-like exonuclease 1